MAISELKGEKVVAKLWTPLHEVESEALTQLRKIASLPWIAHLAVMPDVHFGKGATVGSVIGMRGALSPAAVGVDIGCGMGAIRTNLKASQLPESLKTIREDIEKMIPVGIEGHEKPYKPLTNTREAHQLVNDIDKMWDDYRELHPKVQDLMGRAANQLGTLGGGNHFIELCVDNGQCGECRGYGARLTGSPPDVYEIPCDACGEKGFGDPNVWMMLHSGSRYIGNQLAKIHMSIALDLKHNEALQDKDLSVFLAGTPEMQAYRRDLYWGQRYALNNRRVMFELYKAVMLKHFPNVEFEPAVLCHHNYVAEEKHFGEDLIVTRKGAISAKKGEMGIIPGSMGAKSFIVRGLGNPDSLTSASHGAGRKMSRSKAKKMFTEADLATQTSGVECRKDAGVLDEAPGAYKDIEQVMANQSDLVEVVAQLKQVLCVKGV